MDFSPISAALSVLPFDWLIIALTFFLITIATMLIGPHYGTTLSLSLPISTFLFQQVQHTFILDQIAKQFATPAPQIAIFLIILTLVCVCMYRILSNLFSPSAYPIQAILTGLATTITLVVFFVQPPLFDIPWWHFGAYVQKIFGESYRFWWLLGSYVAFAFARE